MPKSNHLKLTTTALVTFLSTLLIGCSSGNQTHTYWVGGYKVPCTGVGKQLCLLVSKNEDITKANWEYFYFAIEGFEFKEGIAQQIRVQTEELDADKVPQDASSIRYVQTEVLEQVPDKRPELNGHWTVNDINGNTIAVDSAAPTVSIDLAAKTLSGNDTCQDFSVPIELGDFYNFRTGPLPASNNSCASFELASSFQKAMQSVESYSIDEGGLSLNSQKDKTVINLTKGVSLVVNPQLTGNWVLTHINDSEIVNTERAPTLVFDLDTNKVSGSDGCNNYMGRFTLSPDQQIELGPLAVTRRACISDETNKLAQDFGQAMEAVAHYKVTEDELLLSDGEQKPRLRFSK